MKKINWENDLEKYIEEVQKQEIQLGIARLRGFNVNQIIKVQTGKGFFDEYIPDYDTAIKANRTYRTMLLI